MPETVADVLTVQRFADLFARVRRPFIVETPETPWRTLKNSLTDGMLTAHLLHGDRTFGVSLDKRHGSGRIALNIALEVDFGKREEPLAEVFPRILGEPGLAVVMAVHDAGQDLRIPETAWCVSWTGGRSLHFWLTPREPVPQETAYTVAQAIREGVDARIAERDLCVCHAWPTNGGTGKGMNIRLPWGRHQQTGQVARFVNLRDGALDLRDPFPDDVEYLETLERNQLDPEVLRTAATLARHLEPVRPVRPSRTRPAAAQATVESETAGERIERSLLMQTRRIARPCILNLLENGVPEGYRHDVALLLRSELVHCGLTPADAWLVYRRYMTACTPVWEEADARRDLEANWSKTDPALRHLCPGRGDPSPVTRYIHTHCCVGAETCGWRRAAAALVAWNDHLSVDATALYLTLCLMETGHCEEWAPLRPGDTIHTTAADLMTRCRLGRKDLERARADLREAGLVEYRPTGRPDGAGTSTGSRHSLYRRIIPVPDPPAKPDPKS